MIEGIHNVLKWLFLTVFQVKELYLNLFYKADIKNWNTSIYLGMYDPLPKCLRWKINLGIAKLYSPALR